LQQRLQCLSVTNPRWKNARAAFFWENGVYIRRIKMAFFWESVGLRRVLTLLDNILEEKEKNG